MEKIWLKHYPPGVPAEIDYRQFKSIDDLFEKSVEKYRDRPAYCNMGRTISFGELERLSRSFGAWLQAKGVAKGARVAVMMPNCLQYPVCIFGILRVGGIVVNINPLYTARELEYQLKDSGAEAIVILENFAHVLQDVIGRMPVKHVVIAALGDLLGFRGAIVNFVVRNVKRMVPEFELAGAVRFNAVIEEGARLELKRVEIGQEDVAFLQYTGGTTGVSKGATLLHRNILA
ncbi:MAG: AMP-binding protein, partial [Burkholderiales bacterium]